MEYLNSSAHLTSDCMMSCLPLIASRDEVITHNIHFLGEEGVDAEVEVNHGDTQMLLLSVVETHILFPKQFNISLFSLHFHLSI